MYIALGYFISRVVATTAQKVIRSEGGKAKASDTAKLTALLHHLKARLDLVRFTPEASERAREANLAAIAADPRQPFGHAGLAFVYINAHRWGWSGFDPDEALVKARNAARKAVELAPDYYDGHAAMACVHLQENNLDQAIARARRVLELNPNDTYGMCDLAEFLGYAGQFEEAETLLHQATRLDPLYPDWIRWNMAWVQWLAGNCQAALETMNAMTEIPPAAYRVLAVVHMCLGHQTKARDAIKQLLKFDPGYTLSQEHRTYEGKFRNRSDLERVLTHLRAAGLPE